MQGNLRDLVDFVRFIVMRFVQDRCAQIAASLTFTTLLSLVPLLTIALTLFSAFPVFEGFSGQIKAYLHNNLMPEMAGKIITGYMQQFTESAMRLTALGVVFLGATAMMLMVTIGQAFNTIWRVARPRPLLKRLVIYWAVLTLAPLLIGASLSLTSWLVGLSMGYAKHIPIFGVGTLKVLPVLLTTLAFAMLFRLMPNRYVPPSHAFMGAFVAALMFESMNRIFGYYISHFPTYKLVYGAFASIPVFLLWIYLSWLTILIGAVITASLSHWRTPAVRQDSSAGQLLNALRVLQIMANGLQLGRVNTLPGIAKSLHLGYDALERILEKLAGADMVRKAEGQGWLLVRDPRHIHTGELMRLFVLDCGALAAEPGSGPLLEWLSGYATRLEQDASLSLEELFAQVPEQTPEPAAREAA